MLSFFSAVLLLVPRAVQGLATKPGYRLASLTTPESCVAAARGACVKKYWFVLKKIAANFPVVPGLPLQCSRHRVNCTIRKS